MSHTRTMGGGATKETPKAEALVTEVDSSTSLVHLNVHATLIVSICALIVVVLIILLLPCFCCRNMGNFFEFCCNGCSTEIEPIRPPARYPWGRWQAPVPRWPSFRAPQTSLCRYDLETGTKSAVSSAPLLSKRQAPLHSQQAWPAEPLSEPSRLGEILYPPVPPNSREESEEPY